MIHVYADGLAEPVNPGGIACFGYVIYEGDAKLAEGCGVVDHPSPSNNVAEYWAVIHALSWLHQNGKTGPVTIHSDSQLLIYQLNGYYEVRAPRIIPLFLEFQKLLKQFSRVEFQWVPREENEEADKLSRKAYADQVTANPQALERYRPYLATEKQKALMNRLKISYPFWVSRTLVVQNIMYVFLPFSLSPFTELLWHEHILLHTFPTIFEKREGQRMRPLLRA